MNKLLFFIPVKGSSTWPVAPLAKSLAVGTPPDPEVYALAPVKGSKYSPTFADLPGLPKRRGVNTKLVFINFAVLTMKLKK